MVPGTQKGYHVVIDQTTHLATVFEVWFSGYKDNREVQRQIYYGYVETAGQEAPKARHGITNRLQGKGFHWVQDTGIETLEFYPSVLYSIVRGPHAIRRRAHVLRTVGLHQDGRQPLRLLAASNANSPAR